MSHFYDQLKFDWGNGENFRSLGTPGDPPLFTFLRRFAFYKGWWFKSYSQINIFPPYGILVPPRLGIMGIFQMYTCAKIRWKICMVFSGWRKWEHIRGKYAVQRRRHIERLRLWSEFKWCAAIQHKVANRVTISLW